MRFASVLSALTLALALQAPLHAQVAKTADVRVVTINEAEVRSGPSLNATFYVTNRLLHGARVEVIEVLPDGWLKISPPEGSFSWINTRFLDHIVPNQPNNVVHVEDGVPVFIGSVTIKDRRPTVIGAKLQRGAQVRSVGQTMTDADGTWMPIEAPAREFRYIRADAVSPQANGIQQVAHSAPADGKSGALPSSAAPNASSGPSPMVLWRQATQAERTGQIGEAVRLWAKAGADTVTSNPEFSKQALARASYLANGHLNYGAAAVRPAPAVCYSGSAPPPQTAAPPLVRLGSPANSVAARTVSSASVAPGMAPAPSPWPTYVGRLSPTRTARVYLLELPSRDIIYVSPQQGIDIEPYVGDNLQVSGPLAYRADLRRYFMTVMQAQPMGRR